MVQVRRDAASSLRLEPVVALVALPEPCDPASQHCPLHLTLHPLPSPHSPANTFGAEIICLIHSVTHPPLSIQHRMGTQQVLKQCEKQIKLSLMLGGWGMQLPR